MSRTGLILTAVIVFSILFITPPAAAKVSVNVPLGHWGYDAIDKLKGLGLIHSDLRGTRPWTRIELARLIVEADEQFEEIANAEKEEETEEHVKLHAKVRDTGIGIPHGKLKSIFTMFQQADGSTTRKYGGTGLGLSICKGISRAMTGDVWAESLTKRELRHAQSTSIDT